MPESMSEQERFEQGCLSRDILETLGEVALKQATAITGSEIPIENLGGLYD